MAEGRVGICRRPERGIESQYRAHGLGPDESGLLRYLPRSEGLSSRSAMVPRRMTVWEDDSENCLAFDNRKPFPFGEPLTVGECRLGPEVPCPERKVPQCRNGTGNRAPPVE